MDYFGVSQVFTPVETTSQPRSIVFSDFEEDDAGHTLNYVVEGESDEITDITERSADGHLVVVAHDSHEDPMNSDTILGGTHNHIKWGCYNVILFGKENTIASTNSAAFGSSGCVIEGS